MKKYIFIIIGFCLPLLSFSQDVLSMQGTVRSEPGYIIGVYMKPVIALSASNAGANNTLTINITVSFLQSGFASAPTPVITSQIAGTAVSPGNNTPSLENGRYTYNYILTGNLSAFTWNAGVEIPVIKFDFANSQFFTNNKPRLQHATNGLGPNFSSTFYVEGNGWDWTNYTIMFYGATNGTQNGYNYVEALAPLPVTLVAFKAEKFQDKSSHLTWTTASETNSSHFIVQSSTDKKKWTNLGTVKAAGNSQLIQNYEFFDYNVYNGRDSRLTVFYRLQMVDLDSQTKTSPLESVVFGNGIAPGRDFVVYPNPSSDGVQVEWDANRIDQPTSLEFFDMAGKLVYTQKVSENTSQEYIDFGHTTIQPGLYLLRILNGDEPLDFKQIVVGQR